MRQSKAKQKEEEENKKSKKKRKDMEGLNYVPEDMVFSFSDVTHVLAEKVKSTLQDPQPAESGR